MRTGPTRRGKPSGPCRPERSKESPEFIQIKETPGHYETAAQIPRSTLGMTHSNVVTGSHARHDRQMASVKLPPVSEFSILLYSESAILRPISL